MDEEEVLNLNREICGEDRPEYNFDFFKVSPKVLLTKDKLQPTM